MHELEKTSEYGHKYFLKKMHLNFKFDTLSQKLHKVAHNQECKNISIFKYIYIFK